MHLLDVVALLVSLTALLAYANHRLLRLPTTIGVMLIALLLSLALIVAGELGYGVEAWAEKIVARIDFNEALMHGMLSFLLFAGALHVDLNDLARQKSVIGTLATAGILLNSLPRVLRGPAGVLTARDLPLVHSLNAQELAAPLPRKR